jgi:glutathione S-transferase
MLGIHHPGHSQSERIIWPCEELGLAHELQHCVRDPVTIHSPPALKALHPLGAAPLIEDGNLLPAESAAIVEYIIVKRGGCRLKLGPEHPDYANFLHGFHSSNGNPQPAMGRLMVLSHAKLPADHPVQASVQGRLERLMALVQTRLGEAACFAGGEFTAADVTSVFSLTTMRHFSADRSRALSEHPRLPATHRQAARVSPRNDKERSGPDTHAELSPRGRHRHRCVVHRSHLVAVLASTTMLGLSGRLQLEAYGTLP